MIEILVIQKAKNGPEHQNNLFFWLVSDALQMLTVPSQADVI